MVPVDVLLLLEVAGEVVVVAAGDAVVVVGELVVGELVVGEVVVVVGELQAASEASLWTPVEVLLVQLEVVLVEPVIVPTL